MTGKQVFREQPRKALRLRGYDYSTPGAYFVTVCVQNRECLLSGVENDEMKLNDAGKMVGHWWREVSRKFPSVEMDEYVVMPNHFHAVIVLVGADLCVRPDLGLQLGDRSEPGGQDRQGGHVGPPLRETSVPEIMQWFKTMTTNDYISGVKEHNWPRFNGKLWQRGYYEHIVRNEYALDRIRAYIAMNPQNWGLDRENSEAEGVSEFYSWMSASLKEP